VTLHKFLHKGMIVIRKIISILRHSDRCINLQVPYFA
jgi:hypothetical protein